MSNTMKLYPFICTLIIFICFSCASDHAFEERNDNFTKFRWEKNKAVEFRPEISDTAGTYNISLTFRHVFGFQFQDMNIIMYTRSPSGEAQTTKYTIPVADENKQYLSECALDICDLEMILESDVKFTEIGTYRYYISHDMPVDPLPNVMEVGLVIANE